MMASGPAFARVSLAGPEQGPGSKLTLRSPGFGRGMETAAQSLSPSVLNGHGTHSPFLTAPPRSFPRRTPRRCEPLEDRLLLLRSPAALTPSGFHCGNGGGGGGGHPLSFFTGPSTPRNTEYCDFSYRSLRLCV